MLVVLFPISLAFPSSVVHLFNFYSLLLVLFLRTNVHRNCWTQHLYAMFRSISSQRERRRQHIAYMCDVCVFPKGKEECLHFNLLVSFFQYSSLRCFFFMITKICSLRPSVTPVLHIMDAFYVSNFMLHTPTFLWIFSSCPKDPHTYIQYIYITYNKWDERTFYSTTSFHFVVRFFPFFHIRWPWQFLDSMFDLFYCNFKLQLDFFFFDLFRSHHGLT